jgi:hypothetical protein
VAHSALDEGAFESSCESSTWNRVHCSDTDSEGFHFRFLQVPSCHWMVPVAGLSPSQRSYLRSFGAADEYWETSRLAWIAKRRRSNYLDIYSQEK